MTIRVSRANMRGNAMRIFSFRGERDRARASLVPRVDGRGSARAGGNLQPQAWAGMGGVNEDIGSLPGRLHHVRYFLARTWHISKTNLQTKLSRAATSARWTGPPALP